MEWRQDAWRTTKGYIEENAQESTREKKDVMIKKKHNSDQSEAACEIRLHIEDSCKWEESQKEQSNNEGL